MYAGHTFVANFCSDGLHHEILLPDSSILFKIYFVGLGSDNKYYASQWMPNVWQHIAFVYEGSSNFVKIYVNGELVLNESTPNLKLKTDQDKGVYVGASIWEQILEPFKGKIDEVRAWNIARTQDEIKANMNKTLTGNESGLIGYWKFDEGEGQIVYDTSGNGKHGGLGVNSGTDSNDPEWCEGKK